MQPPIPPATTGPDFCITQLLLDAIARRGRTEQEKNPRILLASQYRMRLTSSCLFAGFRIGFSSAAHTVARPIRLGQQGRLQRRSLFLVLLRRHSGSRLEENDMTTPTGPPACARRMSAASRKSNPDLDSRGKSLQTQSNGNWPFSSWFLNMTSQCFQVSPALRRDLRRDPCRRHCCHRPNRTGRSRDPPASRRRGGRKICAEKSATKPAARTRDGVHQVRSSGRCRNGPANPSAA
jgi:hypothetical protein